MRESIHPRIIMRSWCLFFYGWTLEISKRKTRHSLAFTLLLRLKNSVQWKKEREREKHYRNYNVNFYFFSVIPPEAVASSHTHTLSTISEAIAVCGAVCMHSVSYDRCNCYNSYDFIFILFQRNEEKKKENRNAWQCFIRQFIRWKYWEFECVTEWTMGRVADGDMSCNTFDMMTNDSRLSQSHCFNAKSNFLHLFMWYNMTTLANEWCDCTNVHSNVVGIDRKAQLMKRVLCFVAIQIIAYESTKLYYSHILWYWAYS